MKKALLVIDIQNDFLPGGSLAIAQGDQIISTINTLQKLPFDLIIASKDWHPEDHSSFKTLWPVHCVQNTLGSEFPPKLQSYKFDKIIYKGTHSEVDSYSAFFDNQHLYQTELDDFLKVHQILELVIVGLATDYCVKFTALDALNLGYTVMVVEDACKAVNVQPEDEQLSLEEMSHHGVKILTAQEIESLF